MVKSGQPLVLWKAMATSGQVFWRGLFFAHCFSSIRKDRKTERRASLKENDLSYFSFL